MHENYVLTTDHKEEYNIWKGMWNRCTNPTNPNYPDYGARGIKVHRLWQYFVLFMEDMGKRPGPEYSLDRINVNGNYEPTNCRWATSDIQQSNKRPYSKQRVAQKYRAANFASRLDLSIQEYTLLYELCKLLNNDLSLIVELLRTTPNKVTMPYKPKFPGGKPLSTKVAGVTIRSLLHPKRVRVVDTPNPTVFLEGEAEAAFSGPDWEDVIAQVIQFKVGDSIQQAQY